MCDQNQNNRGKAPVLSLLLCAGLSTVGLALPPAPTSSEATITSDQMELVDHGAKTIFEGNVLLKKQDAQLKADRMVRERQGGVIHVRGRVLGTWTNLEGGGNVRIKGDQGIYDPATEIAQLWTVPSKKVIVDWEDKQGKARFYSERAEFDSAARKVRLVNRVTGHVIPSGR